MHQHHSGSHGHHHDHHHGHGHDTHEHDHEQPEARKPVALSKKEKLILRIRHSIRHNSEHGDSYETMAREAEELIGNEAARLILSAGEMTAIQNEQLEKALRLLEGMNDPDDQA